MSVSSHDSPAKSVIVDALSTGCRLRSAVGSPCHCRCRRSRARHEAQLYPRELPPQDSNSKREQEFDLPSNLLDDLTDESGALAQVALGAGDTGLGHTGGGFL
jgi:hypothetical protein